MIFQKYTKIAITKNIHVLRHHRTLHNSYTTHDCFNGLSRIFKVRMKRSIGEKAPGNVYSVSSDESLLNRNLTSPHYYW